MADRAGSGFHVHLSFADASSGNLCADDRLEGSDLLRHAIGGMKALMSDCMAILAPNANSYRRFRANSYAPVAPTWGVNNRTVSLRVPAGPPITRHVEHRVAGADAHPHLVLAALLAAAHRWAWAAGNWWCQACGAFSPGWKQGKGKGTAVGGAHPSHHIPVEGWNRTLARCWLPRFRQGAFPAVRGTSKVQLNLS